MTVEKAKQFLVELADNDDAVSKIDAAYLAALKAAASDLGYSLSDDDVAQALVEMTGLGDDQLSEVAGFAFRFLDSSFSSGFGRTRLTLFGNPLAFQPRQFGS